MALCMCVAVAVVASKNGPGPISASTDFSQLPQRMLAHSFHKVERAPSPGSEARSDAKLVRSLASGSRAAAQQEMEKWGFPAGKQVAAPRRSVARSAVAVSSDRESARDAAPRRPFSRRAVSASSDQESARESPLERHKERLAAEVRRDQRQLAQHQQALVRAEKELGGAKRSRGGERRAREEERAKGRDEHAARQSAFRIPSREGREVHRLALERRERDRERSEYRHGPLPRSGINLSYAPKAYSGFAQQLQARIESERPRDLNGSPISPATPARADGAVAGARDNAGRGAGRDEGRSPAVSSVRDAQRQEKSFVSAVWGGRAAGGEGEMELPYGGVSGARLRGMDPLVRPSKEDRLLLVTPGRNDYTLDNDLIDSGSG
ncbi:hypothetical protein T484DRAFT_1950718 [Baffinella frigidus]|nr:hypothetical protein T484DRAFT_1950718 [Cryptophyta sp. CCMP2293]